MDCTWADHAIIHDAPLSTVLPHGLVSIIQNAPNREYLAALAIAALDPKLTQPIFVYYEPLFVDLAARWHSSQPSTPASALAILSAYARILPFAPHLVSFAQEIALAQQKKPFLGNDSNHIFRCLLAQHHVDPGGESETAVHGALLCAFRLLRFDQALFSKAIATSEVRRLFTHPDLSIRYLAVRVFCLSLFAADAVTQAMLKQHVGEIATRAAWENITIDFTCLELWEQNRLEELGRELDVKRQMRDSHHVGLKERRQLSPSDLSHRTAEVCGNLLPIVQLNRGTSSSLVLTATAADNVTSMAKALLKAEPILVTGAPGSGKTSTIMHLARRMGLHHSLLTLHLNEQTDAKLLIGMYVAASPGTFTWRPGVLTTAVKEGRWVIIEDVDRASTEVMSVLLPLLEKREFLIPSRGETVRAAHGFRLIATLRTMTNARGEEVFSARNLMGDRLWARVRIQKPAVDDVPVIILSTFPGLRDFMSTIIQVYSEVTAVFEDSALAARAKISPGRSVNLRDLFKWCQRVARLVTVPGSTAYKSPLHEGVFDDIFMEASDCFAAFLQEEPRNIVIDCIGRKLQISPQRVEHYRQSYLPKYHVTERATVIGRARFPKAEKATSSKQLSLRAPERPFAVTRSTIRLLEQVAVAIEMSETILLVGETGTGKTTVIQRLAKLLQKRLTVVNLSQQSESGDLLGGLKPISLRTLVIPIKEDFEDLFSSTFSGKKNTRYLETLGKCIARGQWARAIILWKEALNMAEEFLEPPQVSTHGGKDVQRKKRRKIANSDDLRLRWTEFARRVQQVEKQASNDSSGFAFAFVEGRLVEAVRKGDWVLLDEINLASPDTLESITDLLYSGHGVRPSILLADSADVERTVAHPEFRLFGAMNPATDVGKRDLPLGIRSRFTEIFVEEPDRDLDDLVKIVRTYLAAFESSDEWAAHDVAHLYLEAKGLVDANVLVDGADQKPHFSLRTLTRITTYAVDMAPQYGLRRALFEGFSMGFLTLLNKHSERHLIPIIDRHLLRRHPNARSLMRQVPRKPDDERAYVQIGHYWLAQGNLPPLLQPHYIITPFVERNLTNLIRATSTRRFPVLIQGPTSSGKTSMIEYLAKRSGNKFVRINNHEHTDLQEYLGSYVSSSDGQLRFQEGILVQSVRQGCWIVLDELNLAPTDVLEALNRLLDDNRELQIPETQEVVRPHPNFMLFATQNPAGIYGGRKVLSRAFRNRFLELHFDNVPEEELQTILQERSRIAPSFCSQIVAVHKELTLLRQTNRMFEEKTSFVTLRDLFRWALRPADTREQLAINGFMLLGERVRKREDKELVREIIEKVFKMEIREELLYNATEATDIQVAMEALDTEGIIMTKAMKRLVVLILSALKSDEPVLLVGETGCGKTTVCQVLAEALGRTLHTVNAHQNTETGDLIGAQRPLRNRTALEEQLTIDLTSLLIEHCNRQDLEGSPLKALVHIFQTLDENEYTEFSAEALRRIRDNVSKISILFEWSDGALVRAMKAGDHFLLDEISLADDSVLERLNSVLEPQRTLVLAEKASYDDSVVEAKPEFQFMATMNPGGDYGKKELSPALRNRFTEIWVPPLEDIEDNQKVVAAKLHPAVAHFAPTLVQFARWFASTFGISETLSISLRDLLSWVAFINSSKSSDLLFTLVQGAAMVYIDTLGANPAGAHTWSPQAVQQDRRKCLDFLGCLLGQDVSPMYFQEVEVASTAAGLTIGEYSINRAGEPTKNERFSIRAPTTKVNALRILRALQLPKPILLEGGPGVGKTSLIMALANAVGKQLMRINLSEQTDLMDLFGSDVPVEGADAGRFAWRDAPFLQAMQRGHWVLLDELNLASQSVLEGLNACLDHRGEVYVPELDHVFKRHPHFTIFAAQNPHQHGGGRKGLPASFVNRFSVVYADAFTPEDLLLIATRMFANEPESEIVKMLQLIHEVNHQLSQGKGFGSEGSPWEINLRELQRWLTLVSSQERLLAGGTAQDFVDIIFTQRFRTSHDRESIRAISLSVLGKDRSLMHAHQNLSPDFFQAGFGTLARSLLLQPNCIRDSRILMDRVSIAESISICVQQNWPCILVGPAASGKTQILRHLAAVSGANLVEFSTTSDVDTMDLVGGYEQLDPNREIESFYCELEQFIHRTLLHLAVSDGRLDDVITILDQLLRYSREKGIHLLKETSNLLQALWPALKETTVSSFLRWCQDLLQNTAVVDKAKFEWIDGILVKAVQQGNWLVLDNANLCNSSVLDRLNSLMEPEGCLIINEHSTASGDATVIVPHKDFRIFLTVNPRFGELSRAMRNRSVELFLDPWKGARDPSLATAVTTSLYNSSHSRIRSVMMGDFDLPIHGSFTSRCDVAFSHLSALDLAIMKRLKPEESSKLFRLSSHDQSVFSATQERYTVLIESNAKVKEELTRFYAMATESMRLGMKFAKAQAFHPLQNAPLIANRSLCRSDMVSPYWIAYLQDLMLVILEMEQKLDTVQERSQALGVSVMSPLEKSCAASRSAVPKPDVFAALYPLMHGIHRSICSWLSRSATRDAEGERDNSLRAFLRGSPRMSDQCALWIKDIIALWFDSFEMMSHSGNGRRIFDILLLIWKSLARRGLDISDASRDLSSILVTGLHTLLPSSRTTTGQSLECLWLAFKADCPSDGEQAQKQGLVRDLQAQFDGLVWEVKVPLDQKIRISSSIVTLSAFQQSNPEIVSKIAESLNDIKAQNRDGSAITLPYFTREFEAICQQHDLLGWLKNVARDADIAKPIPKDFAVSLLANRSSQATASSRRTSHSSSDIFSGLLNYTALRKRSHDEHLLALRGVLPIALMQKIRNAQEVSLERVETLQFEARYIAHSLAVSSHVIDMDQSRLVSNWFSVIAEKVFDVHKSLCRDDLLVYVRDRIRSVQDAAAGFAWSSQQTDPPNTHSEGDTSQDYSFERIALDYLLPSIDLLDDGRFNEEIHQATVARKAKAWILFSVGLLLLYVPERLYDPALRPVMEVELRQRQRQNLESKRTILERTQNSLTGHNTNLRCEVIEQELQQIPRDNDVPTVFRSDVSEEDGLQLEFSNLLRAVIRPLLDRPLFQDTRSGLSFMAHDFQLLRSNISQMVHRLSENYQSYSDVTAPAVGLLGCLDIGVSLASLSDQENENLLKEMSMVCEWVPFLGGKPRTLPTTSPLRSDEIDELPMHVRMFYLESLGVQVNVEGIQSLVFAGGGKIMEVFKSFYRDWKRHLNAAQRDTDSRSRLYQYRGDAEEIDSVNDADLQEMFPDFSSQDVNGFNAQGEPFQVRTTTSKVATLHSQMFSDKYSEDAQLVSLLQHCPIDLGTSDLEVAYGLQRSNFVENMMSAMVLSVEGLNIDLDSTTQKLECYDFYTDSNIAEAKRLSKLIQVVQERFAELKDSWPEHATPQDVLALCRELMTFSHRDPVAKFLTKFEQLHRSVHQWQAVASREFSVSGILDELTKLIVSWRRLELSTWSRLFDAEARRCKDDASSWWFVAYEAIIEAPLGLSESGEDLNVHAVELLSVLERFLMTTALGQFSHRMQMLVQMQHHVNLVTRECTPMCIVSNALSNFVAYFSHFSASVAAQLQSGRHSLEKEMKDVLLLASWKDTNVEVLRESAKRSHHKLFKLVRKYRALLAQPVERILRQGLPVGFEQHRERFAQRSRGERASNLPLPQVDLAMTPMGRGRPARLVNTSDTVKSMRIMSQTPVDAIDAAAYLEDFSTNLVAQMKDLKKQTPSTLSEENKTSIKHLKSRKRRLFADTLKELRHMGFKHNRGADVLASQSSLPTVLAAADNLPRDCRLGNLEVIQYSFNKSLDLIIQGREAAREHSDDLTSAEVARSLALLESVLSTMIKQRSLLSDSLARHTDLERTATFLDAMAAPKEYSLLFSDSSTSVSSESIRRSLLWLPRILELAIHIITIHGAHAEQDHRSVLGIMIRWKDDVNRLETALHELPAVPQGVSTSLHASICSQVRNVTNDMNTQLREWSKTQSGLGFVFKQVSLWTTLEDFEDQFQAEIAANGMHASNLLGLDQKLASAADTVLVAIQKLENSLAAINRSIEERGWLMKHEACLSSTIKVLRPTDIKSTFEACFEDLACLQSVDGVEMSAVAGTLIAMVNPIVQQYVETFGEAVSRFANLHQSLCKAGAVLAKSFLEIASQGFCGPAAQSSAEGPTGDTTEEGTGLGEGDGIENISKDIQKDEDLSELAQEPNESDDADEREDKNDAVEVEDEMEGELGEQSENEDGTESHAEDEDSQRGDLDEEAASVDDLDPNAIDEKMWDEGRDENIDRKEGDHTKGKPNEEEKTNSRDDAQQSSGLVDQTTEEEEDVDMGADEGERINQEEQQEIDPHTDEKDALELPEELELNGDRRSQNSTDDDDESMGEISEDDDVDRASQVSSDGERGSLGSQLDDLPHDTSDIDSGEESLAQEQPPDVKREDEEVLDDDEQTKSEDKLQDRSDSTQQNAEQAAPSDHRGLGGDGNTPEKQEDQSMANAGTDQANEGGPNDTSESKIAPAEDAGETENRQAEQSQGENGRPQGSAQVQAFKKLGDALERWHRLDQQIRDASVEQQKQEPLANGLNENHVDFEHLQDDDVEADAQALGTASEEQAQVLDESMALDPQYPEKTKDFLPDEVEEAEDQAQDVEMQDSDVESRPANDLTTPKKGAVVGRYQEQPNEESPSLPTSDNESLHQFNSDLAHISLSPTSPNIATTQLWNHYTNLTHSLSLSLTEQLRLILHPTVATKLRGDFRTGKRLNLKRIIPYIASQYRRDKIWLRRSAPSKRAYQILLALDDSKSMAAQNAGDRALQTLVMLARSLTMLEAGQLAVVAFGEHVHVAHGFADGPLDPERGARTLQSFGFRQTRTDVKALLERTLDLFRAARATNFSASSSQADLWQLHLIISDGICEDHEGIRRLVRQAKEERLMIVFVIVDDVGGREDDAAGEAEADADGKGKAKAQGTSILDMSEARFEDDGQGGVKVRMRRYLDGFPFPYYLIVRDVRQLPRVLAEALRGWFGEVEGSG
ncbi:MAG: hypothetical protein M1833_004290 [Piccolia ochrophora]|nr:MAG: hypothetical protein M1833_004290 [Piccolia ochrophora]